MKIEIILPIVSVIIGILGLGIIFIPTEISMTLIGTILMAAGVLGFIAYLVNRKPPK